MRNGGQMATDERAKSPELGIKEVLLIIPACIRGLALAWDSGTFYPLGGTAYSLFTLTEHLGFALYQIPQAILMIFLVAMTFGLHVYTDAIRIFQNN
jgi:hypothetical protein